MSENALLHEVQVWDDGVLTAGGIVHRKTNPDEVERAALALLSASFEMRRHPAWTEGE